MGGVLVIRLGDLWGVFFLVVWCSLVVGIGFLCLSSFKPSSNCLENKPTSSRVLGLAVLTKHLEFCFNLAM